MPDFQPEDDRLIVKPLDEAAPADAETRRGEVVAVGPGRPLEAGRPHPVAVAVGARIVYSKYSGARIQVDGVEYVELPEDEILSVSAE
ncbi:hypothetical protein [Kitasatospora sp. NPDC057015]|uniref:hypothetical protein n=1 Tax=Kitasatospora sp. NPDC057015 TaxID=3346001 RepID=UPI003624B2C2